MDRKFQVVFAKKPDGWHIQKKDILEDKVLYDQLYWSYETKKYIDPDGEFEKGESREPNPAEEFGKNYHFNRIPYYGYKGWADDVISELEGASGLNDTLYEALARAHASKAGDVITSKDAITTKDVSESEDAATFKTHIEKSISAYKSLIQINPLYQTWVGKPQTKMSNDYLYGFFEFDLAGDKATAHAFLPDGLYDDFMINFAKNTLASCKPGAILFTAGDNDTYPMIYVQEKYNFRKDVAIVNTSLINVNKYIEYYKRKYNFDLTLTKEDLNTTLLDYIILEKIADPTDISFFIQSLKKDNIKKFVRKYPAGESVVVPPTGVYMMKTGNMPGYADSIMVDRMDFKVNRSTFYRSDIIQLDIIQSNKTRPVYYTSGAGFYTCFPEYCFSQGVVSQLLPLRNLYFSPIDQQELYNNLMKNYKFGFKEIPAAEIEESSRRIANNYLIAFYYLAESYYAGKEQEKIFSILNKCLDEFNPEHMGPNTIYIGIARKYYMISKSNEGYSLLNKFLSQVEKSLKTANAADKAEYERAMTMIIAMRTDLGINFKKIEDRIMKIADENKMSPIQKY